MSESSFEIAYFVLAGFGLFAAWYFSETQRMKRKLAAAPITPVTALQEGDVVRVVGTLKLGPPWLSAPVSGRPCAVFTLRVHEQFGKSSREIFREKEAVEFLIDDGSATVLVRPERFTLALTEDHEARTGAWKDASVAITKYLASKGQSPETSWGFNRQLSFVEAVLEEGERVAVLAAVKFEPDPDPASAGDGYRDRPMRKVLVTPPDGAMLLSDAPETTK